MGLVDPSFWVLDEVVFAVASEAFRPAAGAAVELLDELEGFALLATRLEAGLVLSKAGRVMVPIVVPTVPLKFA